MNLSGVYVNTGLVQAKKLASRYFFSLELHGFGSLERKYLITKHEHILYF